MKNIQLIHFIGFNGCFQEYHLKSDMNVLEIGCGNGELWQRNRYQIPSINLILSDVSQGC